MDLNKLRIFHHVALYGGIKKASSELRMASSNISSAIHTLEEEISEKLFTRHYRGMDLTNSGKALYKSTQKIFDEISFINNTFEKIKTSEQEISISTTWGVSSSNWMTEILKNSVLQYPDLKIKLVDFNLRDIYENSPDVFIAPYIYGHENLIQKKVKSFCFKMFASDDYISNNGFPTSLDDLDNHLLISFAAEIKNPFSSVDALLHQGRETKNPRYIHIETNSSISLLKLVEEGVGIAVLSTEASSSKKLKAILSENEIYEDIYLIYDKRSENSKNITLLKNMFSVIG